MFSRVTLALCSYVHLSSVWLQMQYVIAVTSAVCHCVTAVAAAVCTSARCAIALSLVLSVMWLQLNYTELRVATSVTKLWCLGNRKIRSA